MKEKFDDINFAILKGLSDGKVHYPNDAITSKGGSFYIFNQEVGSKKIDREMVAKKLDQLMDVYLPLLTRSREESNGIIITRLGSNIVSELEDETTYKKNTEACRELTEKLGLNNFPEPE